MPQETPVYAPQLMLSQPGVQRDGTRLSQRQYVAAKWCRWYQGLPRKMLGYREQLRTLDGIVRQFEIESYNGFAYVHAGTQDVLQRYVIDIDTEAASGLIDRTPVGFMADPLNNWQFSVMYDTANDSNLLFAHAAPNINQIANQEDRSIYYGEVRDTAALLELTPTDPADIYQVSGGVVAIWPYLVRYGNDGFVGWSRPGEPLTTSGTGSGTARPVGNKIIRGLPLRGTGGPACLLWSLDSLVRMQFVGGSLIFNFDTITTSSSILSANSVIEHEGIYYWVNTSGFSMFNGVMRPLENDDNLQWFLDHLNFRYRQKVFCFKIPRWKEIWWCFPYDDATECTHAVIFNYGGRFWYDTELPDSMRSAGVYEQIYNHPILASTLTNSDTGGTSTWQHDFGLNEISGPVPHPLAIRSFFTTNEFSLVAPQQIGTAGIDKALSYSLLEPDFNQAGDLTLVLDSRANARARTITSDPITIPAVPGPKEELTKFKWTGRLTSFTIQSNEVDGNYITGSPLIHSIPSDGRRED